MATPYEPTVYRDNAPPEINAVNLNKLENAVSLAKTEMTAVESTVALNSELISSHGDVLSTHVSLQTNPHLVTVQQVGARHHKNAKKGGALGDGVNDDTPYLQALLDELRDRGGGELYIPNDGGTVYRCYGLWVASNTRVVSDGATLKWYGEGMDSRSQSVGGLPLFASGLLTISDQRVTVPGLQEAANVMVEGLRLDLTGQLVTHSGVHIRSGVDVLVRDSVAIGGQCGVRIDSPGPITNRRVHLERLDLREQATVGIELAGFSDVTVLHCTIRDGGTGVLVRPVGSDDETRDVSILDTLIDLPLGPGVEFDFDFEGTGCEAIGSALIRGATVRNGSLGGVVVDGYDRTHLASVRVHDCALAGNGAAASVGGSGAMLFLISGNDLRPSVGENAIALANADSGSIFEQNLEG